MHGLYHRKLPCLDVGQQLRPPPKEVKRDYAGEDRRLDGEVDVPLYFVGKTKARVRQCCKSYDRRHNNRRYDYRRRGIWRRYGNIIVRDSTCFVATRCESYAAIPVTISAEV